MGRGTAVKRPTIKEVAKLAGVSFKTVARVVNDEPSVRPDLREAVQDAMRMLNYVPNVSARQLSGRRSFLIALLFDISAAYVARAQAGAIRRCREAGYLLIVEEAPAGLETEIATRLEASRVDGVILTPPLSFHAPLIKALADRNLRYVLIAPQNDGGGAPLVAMDDRKAAQEMTRILIDQGHTRIGFILGVAASPAARERHEGFLEALRDAGIPRQEDLEVQGDFTFRGGEAAADSMLRAPDPPTAIFACNDSTALGAMVAAARRGVRVPTDLSVVGFDDTPAASVVWPQLTTVRQPLPEMGAAAVELLLQRDDDKAVRRINLPYEIVQRGSVAPPPRKVGP